MKSRYFYIQLLLIIAGLITLTDSDAYVGPYILAALFGIGALIYNNRNDCTLSSLTRCGRNSSVIISAVCSAFITLANHMLWFVPSVPDDHSALFFRLYKLFLILVIFAGSFFTIENMLTFILRTKNEGLFTEATDENRKVFGYFLIPFICMVAVYLFFFFCCYYPGIMSIDAIDQIEQMFTKIYSNHHPLCHTLFIQMILMPVYNMTGNINTAAAAYVIFQILFMSASFAFLISTMEKLRMPKCAMIAATVWYAVMPFHIMFSFTIWKDMVFGTFVSLFVIFLVRILKGIGNRKIAIAGFFICSVAFCLMRSNGLFSFILTAVCAFILLKHERRLVIWMAGAIVISLIVKHGVFSMFEITQPDTVEMLSIPLQQVTRVLVNDGELADEDRELISRLIDIEKAKAEYDPGVSDPIKNMIRDNGTQSLITSERGAFIKMYLRTLVKNPTLYFIAFADQTKGYWNSGYGYMLWYWDIESNNMGLARTIGSARINTALGEYLWLFYNNPLFKIFVSIGLYVWIMLLAFYRSLSNGNSAAAMVSVPCIAIITSLLVSTPAYSEFRYVYSMFILLPLIISMTLAKPNATGSEASHENNMQ